MSSCLKESPARSCAATAASPPPTPTAVVDVLHRLSALGEDLPEVAELDLNPLIIGPDGCVAVDARVRVAMTEARPQTKTW